MRYSIDVPSLKISTDGLRGLNKSFNVLFLCTVLFHELSYVQGIQTEKISSSIFCWNTWGWDFGHGIKVKCVSQTNFSLSKNV